MTPAERTLKHLRKLGYTAAVVEKWNAHARVRKDLFGVIDVLGISSEGGILGIQATSGSNVSSRMAKAMLEPNLETWLESGGRFQIWGWRKSAKTRRYVLRKIELQKTAIGIEHYELEEAA